MEKDKIITYRINDEKITNDKDKGFKVFYTLERKNGSISYCLESLYGETLNINKINGYEKMLLNICLSNFYGNKEIPNEFKSIITIEEVPRVIKQGFNTRYELYKDLCHLRGTSPSTYGYILAIDEWVKGFEKSMLKFASSDPDMFDDYIEYKVLSEIAQKEASKKGSYGSLEATMSYYLGKYKIKDFKRNEVIDSSMYSRIKNVYDTALTKKVLNSYDELFEKIPEEYKVKYYNILEPDKNKDEFQNYRDLSIKLKILENIEKIESVDSKVKVLVLWSERSDIFKTRDGLNQKEKTQVYTLEEMDELVRRNYIEVKKDNEIYDKTKFLILTDMETDIELSTIDIIDVGVSYTESFTNYLEHYYSTDFVEKLSKFDPYLKNQATVMEEEEEDEL